MTRGSPALCAQPGEEALHTLIAGVLEHLACHLQSGRPRSAMLAAMLLNRLSHDTEISVALRQQAHHLCEVLETLRHEPPAWAGSPPPSPAWHIDAPAARAVPRAAERPRPQPWLTWEHIEEVA